MTTIIQNACDAKHINARQLTEALAAIHIIVTVQTVRNWMKGENFPKHEYVIPICKILGIEPNSLFIETPLKKGRRNAPA